MFSLVRNGQSVFLGSRRFCIPISLCEFSGPHSFPSIWCHQCSGLWWHMLDLTDFNLPLPGYQGCQTSLLMRVLYPYVFDECPFLIRVFIFLLVESEQFLFALDNLSEQVGLLQIFCSRLVACLFLLLIRSLGRLN